MLREPTPQRALIIGHYTQAAHLIKDITAHHPYITIVGFLAEPSQTTATPAQQIPPAHAKLFIHTSLPLIPKWIIENHITLVIIAAQEVKRTTLSTLLEHVPPGSVHWKIIPYLPQYHSPPPFTYKQLNPLRAEDLIGRQLLAGDHHYLTAMLVNKIILITGAGGSIGSEIVKMLLHYPIKQILAVSRSERSLHTLYNYIKRFHGAALTEEKLNLFIGNAKDNARLQEIAQTSRPIDLIVHAAAHKHVPIMEVNEKEAIKNNVITTHNLMTLAQTCQIPSFIFISTDKAVNPSSIMGASKKLAESLIKSFHRTYTFHSATIRLGNVIGSQGSVIPSFKEQIHHGGPITVTHPKTYRYFMSPTEAAFLAITISAFTLEKCHPHPAKKITPASHNTYLLKMGQPVLIDKLMRHMLHLYGFIPQKDIAISYTGLRRGEKLTEILYQKNSKLIPTRNPHILEVCEADNIAPSNLSAIEAEFQNLKQNINQYTPKQVRTLLKNLHILTPPP